MRAINDRAAAGSRQEPLGGSSGTSTSIWATIQASCASLGRFFNSLLAYNLRYVFLETKASPA